MPIAGLFDKDGDGVMDVLSFDEIKNNLHVKSTFAKDPFLLVSELGKTFKADIEKKRLDGTYIDLETELVNDTQALSTIRGFLDANALATEASKRGLPLDYQWKPEEITKLENELLLSLKSFVQESSKKTFDSADQNADQKRADDKVQNDIKNKLERDKLALEREKAEVAKKREDRLAKASIKSINKRVDGTIVPSAEQVFTSGVKVIRQGDKGDVPNNVPVGSKLLSIAGMELFGNDGKKSSVIDNIYVSPKGNLIFQGRKFNDKGVASNITLSSPSEQLKYINSIVKDYDVNGNAVQFKTYDNFKKYAAKTAGVSVGTSSSKKYSNTQESAINEALKSNPGYTRQEIIEALKF